MQRIAIIALSLPLAALSFSHAQNQRPRFQPGEWQINSIVTLSTGGRTNSQITTCINQAGDFWKQTQPGMQCEAPVVAPIPNGYNVKIRCNGAAGPAQWKMESNINETFSGDGTSFQATGTTATQTTVPGQPPMQAMARIQSTGKRTGPCSAKLRSVPATQHVGPQD